MRSCIHCRYAINGSEELSCKITKLSTYEMCSKQIPLLEKCKVIANKCGMFSTRKEKHNDTKRFH